MRLTLRDGAPSGLRVFLAPFDVALPTGDVLEPVEVEVVPTRLLD